MEKLIYFAAGMLIWLFFSIVGTIVREHFFALHDKRTANNFPDTDYR